ncbi:MAG: glutathione S-transferase family protein [Candidatus Binatia bacterium]
MSPLLAPEVRALTGLHLFHFGLSNCSQKVRMVLEEKGLVWTSHHLDLGKNEHITPEYLRINAKGVVPTLVHDGVVVVESSDIMEYLDERFPDPPLRPMGEVERSKMRLWAARQDSIQRSLKILSHEFLFKPMGRKSAADIARYETLLSNRELVAFHREFSSRKGIARSTIAGAVRVVDDALAEVNRNLEGREWIVADAFTLADIAWVVDVHRFRLMHFPMWQYPALRRWYRRVRARPSFQRAVIAFEPVAARRLFRLYTLRRWLLRSHAGAPKWRNPRLLANA